MKLTYPGVQLSTSCVRTEIRLGWALLVVTAAVTGLLGWELTDTAARFVRNEDWAAATGHLVFMGIVAALLYGSVVYQLTRIGSFQRRATFAPATDHELSRTYHEAAGKLVVLVPSYKEEVKVVRRTLMSAALQDYPRRRVVLLIDDPPAPQDSAEAATLHAMRALPESLRQLFDAAAQPFVAALGQFKARAESNLDLVSEAHRLARLHRLAARWCLLQEAGFASGESGDVVFRELVLRKAAQAHLAAAASIKWAAGRGGLNRTRLQLEYHRLARRFRVRLGSFERKRYANLSHEPNKAMNLNSYLGLMGACYTEVHRADGVHLQRAEVGVRFEDAEFVITLDADSMTSPDYALLLIHELRQSGNARVAVAQTPYSSLPARCGTIEYVAGATTDIQYLIHQGFTRYRATYWVGANALLRKAALEDIVVTQMERGFPVKIYIQDRTVIEDTESSIDLIDRGWQLYNYPERLAFSATPPDFGALLIQRRRWANGGLIILPKLLRYLVRGPGRALRAIEGFFRIHYLMSLATVNFGLLVMMGIPFQTTALSLLWLPLSAAPYFFLYARDLVQNGYRASDTARVYALNLLLIPVNLAGVFKSIQQGLTGRKIPFGRTPKVQGRTGAPLRFIVAEYVLFAWWFAGVVRDVLEQRWVHALFGLCNSVLLGYAIFRYVGLWESMQDVRAAIAAMRIAAPEAINPALADTMPGTRVNTELT